MAVQVSQDMYDQLVSIRDNFDAQVNAYEAQIVYNQELKDQAQDRLSNITLVLADLEVV